MLVTFNQGEDHLPYVLSSAVWHYKQAYDRILNDSCSEGEVQQLMSELALIRDVIYPATQNPVPGDKFSIICNEGIIRELITKILNHYLKETKEIISTIEEPVITNKCLQDVDLIENQLIKAIS